MTLRPNILFIMADDHASRAISCYEGEINETPNIDRIASEGMRLNHCYVTNSICTPSRAAILTGTYNHVNGVTTLRTPMDNRLPNVAKSLRSSGYQTAIIGKWHLGEGAANQPTGFDDWSVLPGQGVYFNPEFIKPDGRDVLPGYVTDIITDKCLTWLDHRNPAKPFFLMCHHKAPHRSWEFDPKHQDLYQDDIAVPETFDDDYKNRAKAAAAAKMRIRDDLTYKDLGLVQPKGDDGLGERTGISGLDRKVPNPINVSGLSLVDAYTGEVFTFDSNHELAHFKYQRYLKRYLRTVASIDDNVGRLLDYLDEAGLRENTIVIYTSDQGFFLGEHGWFDKRFIYEQSFQMPFLIRYPAEIKAGSVCNDIVCNVDFAPTFLDFAGIVPPAYMQGQSFRDCLLGRTPDNWPQVAYHRYWMHRDATHNAYAHYGIRDHRYKLIYWYNEGYNLPGTNQGGQDREWELFDLDLDPLELFNVVHDASYSDVCKALREKLGKVMERIGDVKEHVDVRGS